MQIILVSLSPDWPIILLIGVTAWTILLTRNSLQITTNSSLFNQQLSFIPLLLGVGALTIKLSAIPLLLVSGLFYGWYQRKSLKRLLQGIIITTILLLPLMIVGFWTSGCFLYPSSLFCLDVPWTLPQETIQDFAAQTSSVTKWFGEPPTDQIPLFWLITKWVTARNLNMAMMILTIVSLGSFLRLLKVLRKSAYGEICLSGVGLLGIIFVFAKGPLIRFGLGYLLVLPALLLSTFLHQQFTIKNKQPIKLSKFQNIWSIRRSYLVILGTMIVIGLSNPNFWLPSPSPGHPNSIMIKKQVNNISYFSPTISCWVSEIPCNPRGINNVELRKPDLGIKGGFVKTKLSQ